MEINPDELTAQERYKLMIGSVVPRPIAFVSTKSPEGALNLAPYSFFNAVCFNPIILAFFPIRYKVDEEPKDTLKNIRDTGEFVINSSVKSIVEKLNLTSGKYPHGQSEFEIAGLTPAPSQKISVPGVAESPIRFECNLEKLVSLGDDKGGADAVFGRVVHVHIEDHLIDNYRIDVKKLQPVARLAGNFYAEIGNIFEILRPD